MYLSKLSKLSFNLWNHKPITTSVRSTSARAPYTCISSSPRLTGFSSYTAEFPSLFGTSKSFEVVSVTADLLFARNASKGYTESSCRNSAKFTHIIRELIRRPLTLTLLYEYSIPSQDLHDIKNNHELNVLNDIDTNTINISKFLAM